MEKDRDITEAYEMTEEELWIEDILYRLNKHEYICVEDRVYDYDTGERICLVSELGLKNN